MNATPAAGFAPLHDTRPRVRVGVDFDNTIVTYDALMLGIARDWGLVSGDGLSGKREIRDFIRSLPDGETAWQRLQIAAYGTRIEEALPAPGVEDFFAMCRREAIPVHIVSHKTTFPNLGEPRVNLRMAALRWLELRGFLSTRAGIALADVHFESTRSGKIARIAQLGVTHFVDDLAETFEEPDFPREVRKILYAASDTPCGVEVSRFDSWAAVQDHVRREAEAALEAGSAAR